MDSLSDTLSLALLRELIDWAEVDPLLTRLADVKQARTLNSELAIFAFEHIFSTVLASRRFSRDAGNVNNETRYSKLTDCGNVAGRLSCGAQ